MPFCCCQRKVPTSFQRERGEHLRGGRPGLEGFLLTVARQHRTYTGFAFEPFHPGVKAPGRHSFNFTVLRVLKKVNFYSSSKNLVLIFGVAVCAYPPVWALRRASGTSGRGWVGVKLIIHMPPESLLFQHLLLLYACQRGKSRLGDS